MPRACIALRLRARLCRFATATTEGVVNVAAGVEERKVRILTAGGRSIRTLHPTLNAAVPRRATWVRHRSRFRSRALLRSAMFHGGRAGASEFAESLQGCTLANCDRRRPIITNVPFRPFGAV